MAIDKDPESAASGVEQLNQKNKLDEGQLISERVISKKDVNPLDVGGLKEEFGDVASALNLSGIINAFGAADELAEFNRKVKKVQQDISDYDPLPGAPIIELHSYILEAPIDLTGITTSCSWSNGTTPPYGSGQVVLALPANVWEFVAPKPGDWIVIRGGGYNTKSPETRPAVGFYHVKRTSFRASSEGATLNTRSIVVELESWFAMLMRVDFVAAINRQGGTAGTLLDKDEYRKVLDACNQAFSGNVGDALGSFMNVVARVVLPKTLGGGTLGSDIVVVNTKERAQQYCVQHGDQFEPVIGKGFQAFSGIEGVMGPGRTIGQVISSVFAADGMMIELFPCLGHGAPPYSGKLHPWPTNYNDEEAAAEPTNETLDSILSGRKPTHWGENREEFYTDQTKDYDSDSETNALDDILSGAAAKAEKLNPFASSKVGGDKKNINKMMGATPLGAALGGSVPTLVYRIKPWRKLPIDGVPFGENKNRIQPGVFPEPNPWDEGKYQVIIEESGVESINVNIDDSSSINAVTIDPSWGLNPQMKFWERANLPLMDIADVKLRGLRLKDIHWPFFPNRGKFQEEDAELEGGSSMIDYGLTVAYQAFSTLMHMERFFSGSITTKFIPVVEPGMRVAVVLSTRYQQDPQVNKTFRQVAEELGTKTQETEGSRFTFYVDAVSHNIQVVDGGSIQKRTTLTVSYGKFDSTNRGLKEAETGSTVLNRL